MPLRGPPRDPNEHPVGFIPTTQRGARGNERSTSSEFGTATARSARVQALGIPAIVAPLQDKGHNILKTAP
eukprot:7863970-Pyramimonas_sp.AAC.1